MNDIENWKEEMRSAYLYKVVAACEAGTAREGLFKQLAIEAENQALIWVEKIRSQGVQPPESYEPDIRGRIVAALTRRFGPRSTRTVLTAMKVRGMSLYAVSDPRHFVPGAASGSEGRHAGLSGGGNLRAAVFGVNDGLVSNASLILGVSGATGDVNVVILAGTPLDFRMKYGGSIPAGAQIVQLDLDETLIGRIRRRIREGCTLRHVPAKVLAVADIPRTKSGKIVELAVRDVIHGREVKNKEALANPEAL